MNRSDSVDLSPRGLERRGEVLGILQASLRWRIRRRRALRAAGIGAAAAAVVIPVVLLRSGATDLAPRRVEPDALVTRSHASDRAGQAEVAPLELRHARLEVVRNRPGVLERYTVRNRAIPPTVLVGDDELLRELEAADRPSGLMRMDGRVIVLAHSEPSPGS